MTSKYEEYFQNNKLSIACDKMDHSAIEYMKCEYYERLKARYGLVKKQWDINFVNYMIAKIKNDNQRPSDSHSSIYCYDVTTENGKDYLWKVRLPFKSRKKVIPWEQSFEIIWKIHQHPAHANKEDMLMRLKLNKSYYLSKKTAEVINEVCFVCKVRTTPNILTSIYLIDMTPYNDMVYDSILVYDDLKTRFRHLVPVSIADSDGTEIALELMKIFTDFGSPLTVQIRENGGLFIRVFEIIQRVMVLPYKIKLQFKNNTRIHARVTQIQTEIKQMMEEKDSNTWVALCYMLQWKMNTTVYNDNGQTPYMTVFGIKEKKTLTGPAKKQITKQDDDESLIEDLIMEDDDSIPDDLMSEDL